MIECTTVYGQKKMVPKERLVLRVAIYGIAINQNRQVLLIQSCHNKKYFFPGGGLDLGESFEECLKREFREETGIDVKLLKLIDHKETYFYYDPLDEAYQNISFFYLCKPLNHTLLKNEEIKDADAENPAWVAIDELNQDQFFPPADEFIKFIKNYQAEE